MDIATAKITSKEMRGIRHYLLDVARPDEVFTLYDWLKLARESILEIRARNKLPIICGGTGLYIDSLVEGVVLDGSEGAGLNTKDRAELFTKLEKQGWDFAHQKMAEIDAQAAKTISVNDKRRILRFFERLESTGMPLSEANVNSQDTKLMPEFIAFYLNPDRAKLYEKINTRTELIFASGLLTEFKTLLQEYPNFFATQAYQAIAYKEAYALLSGKESREEAVCKLAQSTRNYAKRQLSWFRRKDYYRALNHPQQLSDVIVEAYNGRQFSQAVKKR